MMVGGARYTSIDPSPTVETNGRNQRGRSRRRGGGGGGRVHRIKILVIKIFPISCISFPMFQSFDVLNDPFHLIR